MPTGNQYIKSFQPLLTAVIRDRERADRAGSLVEAYSEAILAARERIKETQTLASRALKSRAGEILYFRHVWPKVYGQLFYFQRAYAFLLERATLDPDEYMTLIRRERLEAHLFFRTHHEFWLYYTGHSPIIDGQFTREYSRGCIYDSLSLVIDQLGATLASHRAAWGVAYGEYLQFMDRQIGSPVPGMSKPKRKWLESKMAALELLKAQEEAGSIEIDGERATMAKLVADFEEIYAYPLGDYNKLLYAATKRKVNSTPYLAKLIGAFTGRRSRLGK